MCSMGAGPEGRMRGGRARRWIPAATGMAMGATLLWGPPGLDAQEPCFDDRRVRVAPALLQDDEGDRTLGVRASAGVCRIGHDTRADFSRSAFWEGSLDATIPLSRVRIPQTMQAGVGGGLSISLARRAPLDLDADPDDPDQRFWDFNHGFLGLGARVAYEADAVWDEHGWVGGAELRWTDPARALLPSVVVALQGVRPVGSALRDGLGVERELHGRLTLSGHWRLPLPGALELAVDAEHFRNLGLESTLEEVGLDSGNLLAGEVGWRLVRPMGPVRLDALFVGYAGGRPPTAVAGRRAWTVGVELGVP